MTWREIPDHWPLDIDSIRYEHRLAVHRLSSAALPGWGRRNREIRNFFNESFTTFGVCPICGWWTVIKDICFATEDNLWSQFYGITGALVHLDANDISNPISETIKYLAAKYDQRFSIHPRIMEEVVASVFRGVGYEAEVTSFSRDGGIDVILRKDDKNRIGVQVKRTKRSIEVEQIRSLLGAMMLKGITQGIFVTTSKFQCGSKNLVLQAEKRGYYIDLIDSDRFLNTLKLSQQGNKDPYHEQILEMLIFQKPRLEFAGNYHLNSL